MLKEYRQAEVREITEYHLVFDDGHGSGYWFPCDKDGRLKPGINPAAERNYRICMEHPERYMRWNEVDVRTYEYTEPAIGVCECGETIEFFSRCAYMGAVQCPRCGRWYNLFGQELESPYGCERRWDDCSEMWF